MVYPFCFLYVHDVSKRIAIIGAGFGGISAAALLARQGHQVTVFEKNEHEGGRASMWYERGFSFDMGPSWYLMPDVFEKFFAKFGKRPSEYYTLSRLDPSYRMFFGDGAPLDISSSLEENKKLFDALEPNGGAKLQTYLDQAEYQYDSAMETFVERDYQSVMDFLDWRLAKEGIRMRMFNSLDSHVSRLFSNDRAKKILEYTTVFLGGNPKNTPALYALIAHVDFNLGVWYPQGGLHAVATGMMRLAQEQGATFVFNAPVEQILVSDGKASGVRVNGVDEPFDLVVSNADYQFTESALLAPEHRSYSDAYWESRTMAPSGFVLFLGLDKRMDSLKHHNLFLQNDWFAHFEEIFDRPAWPDAPSYYVCAPSLTDPSVAPEGKEALFVLVPVASGLEDTDAIRTQFRDKIIADMERVTGESISDHIEVERIFSQRDFTERYGAFQGTALGLAHTLRQTAILRPSMRSKKVQHLFFTGQYVHPGIGVPMVVIASTILSDSIEKQYG